VWTLLWSIHMGIAVFSIVVNIASTCVTSWMVTHGDSGEKMDWLVCIGVCMLVCELNITEGCRLVFNGMIEKSNLAINRRIIDGVNKRILKAPLHMQQKYNLACHFEALSRYMWTFTDVVSMLVMAVVNSARSLVVCVYVSFKEPRLFVILAISYWILWKYCIPLMLRGQKTKECTLWQNQYYALLEERDCVINPMLKKNISISTADASVTHYADFLNKMTTQKKLTLIISGVQNGIVLVLIMAVIFAGQYNTALILVMNRNALFGIVTEYVNIRSIDITNTVGTEKIIGILDGIEEEQQRLDNIKEEEQQQQQRLDNIKEKEKEKQRLDNISFEFNGTNINMDMTAGKVTLLSGVSGSGKTTFMNMLAGLTVLPTPVFATYGKEIIQTTFKELLDSRIYIQQTTVEDYIINGSIRTSHRLLFPGATDIYEIRDFLSRVFLLKDTCLPKAMDDEPREGMCGGEKQRYVVASQLWKIQKANPEFILLDEIDRALDKPTAVHILKWIVQNIPSRIVLITHLKEEVQDMLNSIDCMLTF